MKADHTVAFERELEELILTSFSRGAAVEGEWEIAVPVSDAPNWTVTITKRTSDDESGYDPSLLED